MCARSVVCEWRVCVSHFLFGSRFPFMSSSKNAALDDQSKRQKLNQNKRSRGRQCKQFAETGSCRFDKGCRFAHVVGAKAGEDVSDRIHESLSTGEIGEATPAAANAAPAAAETKADEDVTMT